MGNSCIDAKAVEKNSAAETSSVTVDVFAEVVIDGMFDLHAQKKKHDKIRNPQSVEEHKKSFAANSGKTSYEYVNPDAICGDDTLADYTHRHIFHVVELKPNERSYSKYKSKIRNTFKRISQFVDGLCLDSNVGEVRIHTNILGYNHGNLLSNLLGSMELEEEDILKRQIEELFHHPEFFRNNKISYNKIEYAALCDIVGDTTGSNISTLGYANNAADYSDITGAESRNRDRKQTVSPDAPTNEDIVDAVIMCQHTYDRQSSIEKSVIDWAREVSPKIAETLKSEKGGGIPVTECLNLAAKINDYLLDAYGPSPSIPVLQVGTFQIQIGPETLQALSATVADSFKTLDAKTDARQPETVKETDQNISVTINKDGQNSVYTADWYLMSDELISKELLEGKKLKLKDYLTGFYSSLYKKRGENKYAYCTCGTNFSSVNDWLFTNILQGATGLSLQYSRSVHIAKILDKAIEKKKGVLFFTGHSLGGGLASNNALVTKKRHAITFNAAGLHIHRVLATLFVNNIRDLFHPRKRKEKIHAFVLDGELLNWASTIIWQKAYGTRKVIKIGQNEPVLSQLKGRSAKHALTNFLLLKDKSQLTIVN